MCPQRHGSVRSSWKKEKQEEGHYLVDEGSKAVVQRLDLLLLLGTDGLDGGVDLQIQGSQQALVDRHCIDGDGANALVSAIGRAA